MGRSHWKRPEEVRVVRRVVQRRRGPVAAWRDNTFEFLHLWNETDLDSYGIADRIGWTRGPVLQRAGILRAEGHEMKVRQRGGANNIKGSGYKHLVDAVMSVLDMV
jgi:hypothetical protein